MRCHVLGSMTIMSAASVITTFMSLDTVTATPLHDRRTKKATRPHRSSDRRLQITIWPEYTTVTSTNSSTDFPTLSPIPPANVFVDPSLIDPRSCKSGKGRTCTPSTRPSVAPSEAPSISHMPTISFQPSASPSISSKPSVMPSQGPTPLPSASPSLDPSPQPSAGPTNTPTISSPPTMLPSSAPSGRPSPSPTMAPTISSQPTITAAPSQAPVIDPNGVVDRIVTDDAGHTGVTSTCRRAVPESTTVTDQLVVYEYDVTTTPGTDVAFVTDTLATRVQKEMSRQFLTCTFDAPVASFDTATISSLPHDVVTTTTPNCTSDGADCHRINAAFTATIFYYNDDDTTNRRRRHRQLQQDDNTTDVATNTTTTTTTNATTTTTTTTGTPSDVITDPTVAEQFSLSLQSFFDSGEMTSGLGGVQTTEFQGLANDDSVMNNDDDATNTTDGNDDSQQSSDKSLSGGQVAGSVIGTLVGLALIAVLVTFFILRRRQHNDDDNDKHKARAMDVTQEDFHDLGHYNDEYDDRDDRAMIDRSIIASDDGSFQSGYTGKMKPAFIIEDDQDTLYGQEFPKPTEPSFSERIRSAEQPGPTFVKTNEVLYQMNKSGMGDEMEYALERSVASAPREYGAPDTVQL